MSHSLGEERANTETLVAREWVCGSGVSGWGRWIGLGLWILGFSATGTSLPTPRSDGSYVGSEACRSCHREEHASWHRTYHRTMTQAATEASVLGEFDGTRVISEGLEYRVGRDGDQYWADMPDPDVLMYVVQGGKKLDLSQIPQKRRPVVMTTGSHHYQTYWVSSERYPGLLQTLPLVYLREAKRWIPREAAFMRGPGDTGRFVTQWNHHCIRCHSTGGNPGLDEGTGQLRTQVGELGISCEACHGPGGDHVRWRQAQVFSGSKEVMVEPERLIVHPAKLDSRASSQICGQCHGVYVMRNEFAMDYARHGPLYRAGDELGKTRFYMQPPTEGASQERWEDWRRNREFFRERWWDDGTILAGGREYTAMAESACHLRGKMSCLSCHSMHDSDPNDQLKTGMESSKACLQCHQEPRFSSQLESHTHHRSGSAGSECMNCHMPHTTYALMKAIRSHQIQSPRVASSVRHGVPNACNLCHLDQTLAWTGKHLTEWYGQPVEAMTEEQRDVSAVLLWLLKGNAAQRVIAGWHMGWEPAMAASGSGWQAPFQAELLADEYGVVRYVAAERLRHMPGFASFAYDFLGEESIRRDAVANARDRWRAGFVPRWLDPGQAGRILMSEDGAVREDRLRAMVAAKDRRSVTIKE